MSDDAIVSSALPLEGLSWSATPDRYTAELWPNDTEREARGMAASQESCGLVCEAILRRAEVDGQVRHLGQMIDVLRSPWGRRGSGGVGAVSYLETLGRQRGLWVPARVEPRPVAGDMVVVLGPTHALTVVGWDGDALISIDGGQTDPGNSGRCTAIRQVRRLWRVGKAGPCLIDQRGLERRVYGWLEAGKLPCR